MVKALFLAGLLLLAAPVAAQYRVAYVDADRVIQSSPQFEEVVRGLEEEFNRRREELRSRQEQLRQLEEKLSRDGAVMSSSEVRKLEQDIRSHQRRLKHSVEELDEDMSLRRNDALSRLLRQVQEVVREVGREEQIDLIFSTGVAYFSERADISELVLERLREKYRKR